MLVLLTPTRNRPLAFGLLEYYVARQTLRPDRWVVCCDGGRGGYEFNLGQVVIDRTHAGGDSVCRNYLACLERCQDADKFLFGEDDDWYRADFVETYSAWLDRHDLVGLTRNKYYHVGRRAYLRMDNTAHASLACTGITRAALPCLRKALAADNPYVDLYLWRNFRGARRLYTRYQGYVGIKGMPGEEGVGIGHCLAGPVDRRGSVLKKWLGPDAERYRPFYTGPTILR